MSMTLPIRIGHLESSRMPDLQRLFTLHYPQCVLTPVSTLTELAGVDALLAGGGPDLHPSLYGQPNRWSHHTDAARDRADEVLLRAALQLHIPFLGLCRGAQLLNVVLGGTLYQDLEQQRGAGHPAQHVVRLVGEGAARFGAKMDVNSSHHQGVDRLAPSLTAIAFAPDGLPEAWVQPGALAVQFHPETLVHHDIRWLPLFDWWLEGVPIQTPVPVQEAT
jgi:putative glutamine amidotransferase